VEAATEEEAQQKFEDMEANDYGDGKEDIYSKTEIESVENRTVHKMSLMNATSERDLRIKSANHIQYDFISENTNNLNNDGFCVIDNFVSTYGPKIAKVTREWFISQINILNNSTKFSSGLDVLFDEHGNEYVDE
jgi:hypothetical protein